jgi:hypothetical protein
MYLFIRGALLVHLHPAYLRRRFCIDDDGTLLIRTAFFDNSLALPVAVPHDDLNIVKLAMGRVSRNGDVDETLSSGLNIVYFLPRPRNLCFRCMI